MSNKGFNKALHLNFKYTNKWVEAIPNSAKEIHYKKLMRKSRRKLNRIYYGYE